ncbi:MAG: zinc ribbon domain-containing protein [Anaerotignum sp.]|nr:zinc ribbon domain-containing protein [Anaerotignum sp.]
MAFFDKLGEMTKIVSEKANDSLATNNLIAEINLTKGNIQALQRELGEHYWAKFAVGEKLDDEAMFICDKIVLAQDKIKVLENQIEQIKAEGEARKAERAAAKAEQKAAEEAEKAAEKVEEAEKAAEKAGIERPVCAGCGADLTEGVKFCGQCGTPVEAAEPVEGVVE